MKNQRFSIIYNYGNENLRKQIFEIILQNIKNNFRFDQQIVQTPLFQTKLNFPTLEEINSIPMNIQVEEVIVKKNKIYTIKKLIIEVEIISSSENKNPNVALIKVPKIFEKKS